MDPARRGTAEGRSSVGQDDLEGHIFFLFISQPANLHRPVFRRPPHLERVTMFIELRGKLSVSSIFSFFRGPRQASADLSMCPRHHMRRRKERFFSLRFQLCAGPGWTVLPRRL